MAEEKAKKDIEVRKKITEVNSEGKTEVQYEGDRLWGCYE